MHTPYVHIQHVSGIRFILIYNLITLPFYLPERSKMAGKHCDIGDLSYRSGDGSLKPGSIEDSLAMLAECMRPDPELRQAHEIRQCVPFLCATSSLLRGVAHGESAAAPLLWLLLYSLMNNIVYVILYFK